MFPHLFAAYIFERVTDVRRRIVSGNRAAHEGGGYFPVKTSDFLYSRHAYLIPLFRAYRYSDGRTYRRRFDFFLSGTFCFKEIKKMEQMSQNGEVQ